jgi:hypothetical protein
MSQNLQKQVINEIEAAKYIGMSPSYLRMDRCEGHRKNRARGPAYLKIGKAVRYRIADLDEWLDKHRREG